MLKFLSAAALATALSTSSVSATCDWSSPGENPYRGSLSTAVFSYTNIPYHHRIALSIAVVGKRVPTDRVWIYRDRITSPYSHYPYHPELYGMHFGRGTKCDSAVNRSSWASDHYEPANIYCAGGYCLAIPDVCSNVSQVYPIIVRSGIRSNTVPEPDDLLLLLIALASAGIVTWIQTKK
jgi:hypothetical protein